MHRDANEAKLSAYRHAVKLIDATFRESGVPIAIHELVKAVDRGEIQSILQDLELPPCFDIAPNQRMLKTMEAPGPELDLQWTLHLAEGEAWLQRGKSDDKRFEFEPRDLLNLDTLRQALIRADLSEQAAILIAMQHKAMTLHDTLALETGGPTYGVEIEHSHAKTM
jgi:hypothetical protein